MEKRSSILENAYDNILIDGERIILRPLKKSDARDLCVCADDEAIAEFTPVPHPFTLKNAEDYINDTNKKIKRKKGCELGIELKETEKIIGMMSLFSINNTHHSAELGFWLGRSYWRKRITSEAIKLIILFGFERLNLERIYAKVMHPNTASSELLLKLGFKYEGTQRKSHLKNGKWMDVLAYSILKDESDVLN